jgi:hypothetical protein
MASLAAAEIKQPAAWDPATQLLEKINCIRGRLVHRPSVFSGAIGFAKVSAIGFICREHKKFP